MKQLPIIIFLLFLTGCYEPLDKSQTIYVGLWKNNQTSLLITESGHLEYNSKKGAVSTSISLPIKDINETQIEAGFLFFTSTFKLEGKPKEEAGMFSIVVDGEKLFKTDEQGRIPAATKVPTMEQIRTLVNNELTLLSESISTNNFNKYLESASLVYQSQFTNQQLIEAYSSFNEQEIVVSDWMIGDFILTNEPSIDKDGILTIEGKYQTSPDSLKFSLSFIYAHPNWKSFGANLNINNQ